MSNDNLILALGLNIRDLQRDVIEDEIRYNFYCGSSIEAVYILINEAITLTEIEGYTTPEISKFITDISLLSSNTAESIAYKGSIRFLSDNLVIKVPKKNNENILHEYFIGQTLNELRYEIPNFMCIFGLLKCGQYESDKPLCNNKGDINYLITELIPGKCMYDEITSGNMTRDELYNWTIQVLLTLAKAEEDYKFTHYDLHIGNIIIRRNRESLNYSYNINGREYWMISDSFPTIIDYGMSRITVDDTEYPSPAKNLTYGVDGTFKPGIDVYKFLYSIMGTLKKIGSPFFTEYYSIFGELLIFYANDVTKKFLEITSLEDPSKMNYSYPALGDTNIYNLTPMDILSKIDGDVTSSFVSHNLTRGYITLGVCEKVEDVLTRMLTPTNEKTCSGDPWKKLTGHWKDRYGNERYWFDCGIFTFDGRFNVVTFPKGMSLYHGSPGLTFYGVEYPLGIEYYASGKNRLTNDEKNILRGNIIPNVSQKEIEKILGDKQPITLGYYGDLEVAMGYSQNPIEVNDPEGDYTFKCGINCVSAYTLKKDITMLDLYDPFNIYALLTQNYLSEKSMKILLKKYNIEKFIDLYKKIIPPTSTSSGKVDISDDSFQQLQQAYNPFRRFLLKSERGTIRDEGYRVPIEILALAKRYGYSGFINPRSPYLSGDRVGQYRFGEFVFGDNVLSYLSRDFGNVYDWQYYDNRRLFGEIGELVRDMWNYTTTNIDFHSGDLYEHSIWSALYVQRLFTTGSEWVEGLSSYDIPLAIISAFLHDIGKAGDMVYTYYEKENHSLVGFEYLTGNKPYIYIDKNGEQKILDINRLLKDLNMDGSDARVITFLILAHWEMGKNYVSRVDREDIRNIALDFIEKMEEFVLQSGLENVNFPFLMRLIMLISAADVMASQVYIPYEKLRNVSETVIRNEKDNPEVVVSNINAYLEKYPYLVNRPKKHRGGNKYKDFDFERKGLILRREVLNIITYNTLMEKPSNDVLSDYESDYEFDEY